MLSTIARASLPSSRVVCASPHTLHDCMSPSITRLTARGCSPYHLQILSRTYASVTKHTAAADTFAGASATPETTTETSPRPEALPKTTSNIVAYHLLASAALVFVIVIVGGITRLTESGLSITEWNPGLKGMRLPSSEAEWYEEWDKYKQSPEFLQLNSGMTLEDFKTIFMWEWSHRMLGRFIGAFFVIPAVLFSVRRSMTTLDVRKKLFAIAAGIGFQGFLGWYMVSSGLKNPYENESAQTVPRPEWTPRVDHFRLAAHLGTAFAVYIGMVYTAVSIIRDNVLVKNLKRSPDQKGKIAEAFLHLLQNSKARTFRRVGFGMLLFTFTTAMYGAFVAGLDAGLVYSEFPFMGEGIFPPKDEMFDPRYAFRVSKDSPSDAAMVTAGNVTQNPVTVQAIHRVLGISTVLAMFMFLSYSKRIKNSLPSAAPRFAMGAAHMSAMQAILGITTLMYMVPLPLASLHQAGSVVLLTMLTCVLGVMKKPNAAIRAFVQQQRHLASKVQVGHTA